MLRRSIAVLFVVGALSVACSPSRIGIHRMADALSSTASAYSKDDDPEFVRLAAPSTLKMVEMLIEGQPAHRGLLMTACSGFAQYAYGFLQLDAERADASDPAAARELRARAGRMYARAREYCVRGLEVGHPGIRRSLSADAVSNIAGLTKADVPALYWTGVSIAGSVSVAENQLVRVGDLALARALLMRALALDESWEGGAIHEAFVALDGQPRLLGGSAARARDHFTRAVELSGGQSASIYVTMAESVALPARNRAEFEQLLRQALAIDIDKRPEWRLANALAQTRARFLLSRSERLFG